MESIFLDKNFWFHDLLTFKFYWMKPEWSAMGASSVDSKKYEMTLLCKSINLWKHFISFMSWESCCESHWLTSYGFAFWFYLWFVGSSWTFCWWNEALNFPFPHRAIPPTSLFYWPHRHINVKLFEIFGIVCCPYRKKLSKYCNICSVMFNLFVQKACGRRSD